MFAALHRQTTVFLRHAGVLAGLSAIIAGILGMHIISGSHDMAASAHPEAATANPTHSAAAMATAGHAAGSAAHGGNLAVSGVSSVEAPGKLAGTPMLQSHSCAEPSGCPAMSGMDPGCTPYPGNSTLAAPPPGRTVLWTDDEPRREPRYASYPYRPGTPSPGELCISRT